MRVLVIDDPAEAAARVAGIVADVLRDRADAVLGLATGETMRPVYARLVELHRAGRLDLSRATTFNLDEYVGIAPDHPASFHSFMRETLFGPLGLEPARTHLPRGDAADPAAEARRYEAAIAAAGGIDLQLLGIGRNGHVAFNEPASSLASRTRVTTLAEATRTANAPAFGDEPVPRRAITTGIATILDTRACVLLATGAAKSDAVARMVEGPLGADCPATALQLHPATTVVLDAAAASRLALRDRYETAQPGRRGLSHD